MSADRLLDAEAIEEAAKTVARPTARMHLEALAKKLRKEGEALQRVENASAATAAPAAAPTPAVTPAPVAPTVTPTPTTTPAKPTKRYTPVDRFAFDAGSYDAPYVTCYIPLPGVGSIPKDQVQCEFTKDSFDLIVSDLSGQSYRILKTSLEKDIEPSKSKYIIKADKVLVKLHKVKTSEYGGYDHWSKLTDPNKKSSSSSKNKDNPQAGIMQMMKDMYDQGDDNMRKVIGETFMKQQRGELGNGAGGMADGLDDI